HPGRAGAARWPAGRRAGRQAGGQAERAAPGGPGAQARGIEARRGETRRSRGSMRSTKARAAGLALDLLAGQVVEVPGQFGTPPAHLLLDGSH
ncbi:hypothetical protein, partial [Salmonella enterica]|uniref:hypothetical protein n=1 Tax=Salmonella enterica TaxID=28901 RepID=UPI0021B44E7D